MKIDIWFEFASTYSYLTVSRAEDILNAAGIAFQWQPFLLGPIFRAKDMPTSPFVLDPIKGAYMWRDIQRRAERLGLPFKRPPHFPMNGLRAARIMTAARGKPWAGAFARHVFTAQFAHGQDISDSGVLTEALTASDVDPAPWLAAAQTDETKAQLRSNTDRARSLGIFGAPSFVVGQELFWGDDRLEDAIDWATNRRDPSNQS